ARDRGGARLLCRRRCVRDGRGGAARRTFEDHGDRQHEMHELSWLLATIPKVTIAAINGAAAGKSSPLFGMPILEVGPRRSIIVLKRSTRPGFAGVDNDLDYNEKCMSAVRRRQGQPHQAHHRDEVAAVRALASGSGGILAGDVALEVLDGLLLLGDDPL